jgi:F-type H+-transporting ATPase subunit alpha
MENQVMVLYAAINGYIDDVPLDRIADFEENLYRFMEANHPKVGQAIVKDGDLSKETEAALKEAIDDFKKGFATQ